MSPAHYNSRVLPRVREAAARASLGESDLAAVPEIKGWREAYKAFGVKKTSYRSSVERLLKNLQRGQALPRVNALVDAYNAVSVRHRMPVGADDLDHVAAPLAFCFARGGDSLHPYAAWLETYADEGFATATRQAIAFTDAAAGAASATERTAMRRAFAQSSRFELEFFDAPRRHAL